VENLLQVVVVGWIRNRGALHDEETSAREQ